MDKRAAGILMPITSLPSEYGIGCFQRVPMICGLAEGSGTELLADSSAGTYQLRRFSLPVLLHFAGNPYFISLKALVEEGVLTKEDCDKVSWGRRADSVDYEKSTKAVISFSAKLTKTATSARIRIIRNLLQKTAGGFPTMHFLWQ